MGSCTPALDKVVIPHQSHFKPNTAVLLVHYMLDLGSKSYCNNSEISYKVAHAQQRCLEIAKEKDYQWLIVSIENAMEVEWLQYLFCMYPVNTITHKQLRIWFFTWCANVYSKHHNDNTSLYAGGLIWVPIVTHASFNEYEEAM